MPVACAFRRPTVVRRRGVIGGGLLRVMPRHRAPSAKSLRWTQRGHGIRRTGACAARAERRSHLPIQAHVPESSIEPLTNLSSKPLGKPDLSTTSRIRDDLPLQIRQRPQKPEPSLDRADDEVRIEALAAPHEPRQIFPVVAATSDLLEEPI